MESLTVSGSAEKVATHSTAILDKDQVDTAAALIAGSDFEVPPDVAYRLK